MKKLVLLVIAVSFLGFTYAQHTPWRQGEMEVKITFHQSSDASRLASLHLNCDIYPEFASAYILPPELEQIKQAGFDFQVMRPDLNAWSASFGKALVPNGYYTFSEIRDIADSLTTNFPSICKKVVFGHNAQMQELAALKISDNVTDDEAEPEILFDGGIHGDEVGGSQNVIQFARDLCLGYGSDSLITSLVDEREIWLYYCVNPFGRDNMTRYNSAGIDLNRDNGYMWGAEGGSLGSFSQPESRALRDCQYSNQFVVYTNYHSGSETISYPWSYRYSQVPDKPSIDNLAKVYSVNSGYSGLPYGQGSVIMYLIQGSTKDFNYGSLGSVAWSIEISVNKQPTNVQYYYTINKPAMLALVQHAGYGIQGTITDAILGTPVNAAIFVGTNYPVYSDGKVGDFHKYLVQGTYTIRIEANGYTPKTISGVVVSDLQCTTLNVQLDPVASQYGYRVVATQIPAFNAQDPGDEGYTAACLGPPDNIYYSLGRGGYIIVDMQDTIFDGEPGTNDIAVYEGDSSPEGYSLFAGTTMDGPWMSIGSATGSALFNMQPSGLNKARYFKLVDDNDGQPNVIDAGFDFDAIKCVHPAKPDTMGHLSGYAFDAFTHLPLDSVAINWQDKIVFTDETGKYVLELNRGTDEVCAMKDGFKSECDTLQVLPGPAYTHDFFLFPTVGKEISGVLMPEIRVAPNPFSTFFDLIFSFPEPGRCEIELFDLSGRRVSDIKNLYYASGFHRFDGASVLGKGTMPAQGSYYLVIHTSNSVFRFKLIKAL
jgi:hypothetical protein